MVNPAPRLSDLQNHWARPFVEALVKQGIISGFPDGTFRPDLSMTRVQYAAVIKQAFSLPAKRQYAPFVDVPANHWGVPAIQKAYEMGFLSGIGGNRFQPNDRLSRLQIILSLTSGLNLGSSRLGEMRAALPSLYLDAAQIPAYAVDKVAIATEKKLVVNYPNLKILNPNLAATRADVAVSIYQALLLGGRVPEIDSIFVIVPPVQQVSPPTPTPVVTPPTPTPTPVVTPPTPTPTPVITPPTPTPTPTPTPVVTPPTPTPTPVITPPTPTPTPVITPPTPTPTPVITPPTPTPAIPQTVKVGHAREFRGLWIATVWNTDWPSNSSLSTVQEQEELIKILDRARSANFNAVILQVRSEGDAMYASSLEPWSAWLTGTQGKAPEPLYDPLEFAIAEAHRRNLELHAWLNPCRASVRAPDTAPLANPHIGITNPEAVYPWSQGKRRWMDPGINAVRDRLFNVATDLVRRYDLDGLHVDDSFYPYPIANEPFPDEKTYAAYQAGGGQLSLADWRRDNVNTLVQRLSTGIKAIKPQIKFGASVFGIWKSENPPQIRGMSACDEIYADSKKWLEQGWVDYLAPQLYWPIDQTAQSYTALLRWWTENNPKNRHIYAASNLSNLKDKNWELSEIERQVEVSRSLRDRLSLGNIFFSANALMANTKEVTNKLTSTTFARPALVPAIEGSRSEIPPLPKNVTGKTGQISWDAATAANLRAWMIYKQEGGNWNPYKILPITATTVNVEAGTYAVSTVNKTAQESEGIVVTVT